MKRAVSPLIKQNLWANMCLLDTCAHLDDNQLGRVVVGTYGSIRNTWVHRIAADGQYVALLRYQQPDHRFGERIGFTSWEDRR